MKPAYISGFRNGSELGVHLRAGLLFGAHNTTEYKMSRKINVAFLSGTRQVAAGFNATGPTAGDKEMEILLHRAPRAGAEDWIKDTLTKIARAKEGNAEGTAIQILRRTQKQWDQNASVSPAAMA